MPQVERRARNWLFTMSIAGEGGEHKLISVSNLRGIIEPIDHNESSRIDTISLAAHFNVDNLTVREAPIMGCIGEPAGNYLFEVEVNGDTVARCRRLAGLGVRWEVTDNRESDQLGTQKLWGHRTYPEVTLESVIDWQDGWQLYKKIFTKLGEFTGPGPQFVRTLANCPYVFDVNITLVRNDGQRVAKWALHRAWPTNWQLSDLSADANEVALESVTFRVAPLPGGAGITEDMLTRFSGEHLVSSAWYDWVAKAYDVPEKKDLILNIYHPGAQPGKDAPAGRLKLFNCWVSEISYSDFDATANEVATRDLTITFEGVRAIKP